MVYPTDQTYLWPDPDQELLLRAATRPPQEALRHFLLWQQRSPAKGAIDQASLRVLPMVYENLRNTDCESLPDLRAIRNHFWAQAQAQRRVALAIAKHLHAQKIETMAGKGMALLLGGYFSPGIRPMADIDLYVRRKDALAAVRCVKAMGWRDHGAPQLPMNLRLLRTQSITLRHASDGELDLHWHCLAWIRKQASDDLVWAAASLHKVDDIPVRIPCANHLVFHAITHGVYRDRLAPFRWILDVVRICREQPDAIDWLEQAEMARNNRLFSRWKMGVDYLASNLGEDCQIPAIAPHRVSLVEAVENLDAVANTNQLGSWSRRLRAYLALAARIVDGDQRWFLPVVIGELLVRKLRGLVHRGPLDSAGVAVPALSWPRAMDSRDASG